MASYALLELGIQNLGLLGRELVSRPWLTLGMTGWIILFLLTLTSTQAAQRKMGKRWQTLHNYVYLTAILLPLHYLWSVKVLSPLPIIYAICFVVLLAFRYKKLLRKTRYKGVFMKSE